MADLFYLQDSRSNVGTGAMWWQEGGGYGTNLDRAEAFNRYPLLHKPTGKRYQVAYEAAGMVELHQENGPATYASADALKNTDVWELNE